MEDEYETILQRALALHPADRARLVHELSLSLAAEAGLDPESILRSETSERLDDNLAKSKEIESERIEAALQRARDRNR